MIGHIAELISTLNELDQFINEIVEWGAPIPFFGNISPAKVATVGINPSIREYKDFSNQELTGTYRRLETLNSLGLKSWLDADHNHLNRIRISCETYFNNKPYNRWFGKLNQIISNTGFSYYDNDHPACHLDLVPFATYRRWSMLNKSIQIKLMDIFSSSIAAFIRSSSIETIIVNGRTVIEAIKYLTKNDIKSEDMAAWVLPRRKSKPVPGISYQGYIYNLSGIELDRPILILGYNHNIQSSFGITTRVIELISNWIGIMLERVQYAR